MHFNVLMHQAEFVPPLSFLGLCFPLLQQAHGSRRRYPRGRNAEPFFGSGLLPACWCRSKLLLLRFILRRSPDEHPFPLKGKAVFAYKFRWDSFGNQSCFVLLFFYLGKGSLHGIFLFWIVLPRWKVRGKSLLRLSLFLSKICFKFCNFSHCFGESSIFFSDSSIFFSESSIFLSK